MALDDNDRRILTESFKDALASQGGGSFKGGGKIAGETAKPSIDTSGVSAAGSLFSSTLKTGGEAAGKLTGAMGDSVGQFQKLSDVGQSFNNNAIGMRDSIAGTRLSMDEYNSVMQKLNPSIAGLGGTVDQGAKNFNKFSNEFIKTDAAERLTKLGYTTKDLNDVMAANMANRRFTDLSDDAARKKAIEATAQLAVEMDATAKLTGISRQEQMADMKARSENGKVQAAIQLEVMRGGKDVEQQYNNMQQSLNGLGKGVKDLADEMFTGGVRTEEGAAKMAALGPAGVELQKAVEASKTAKTQEEKDAAARQLERAKMAVNERMKSEEFLQAVMVAGGRVGPAMQKMYEENRLKAGQTFAEQKGGKGTAETQVDLRKDVAKQQAGVDLETGKKDEGAKTTELYIQGINRVKDVSAGATTAVNAFNNELAKTKLVAEGLQLTKARTEVTNPKTGEKEYRHIADAGVEGLMERLKNAGGGTTAKAPAPTSAKTGAELTGSSVYKREANPVAKAGEMGLKALGAALTSADPGFVNILNMKDFSVPKPESRDGGTMGMTGSLLEPKDIFANIHKGEMVLTPEQQKNFLSGAKSSGIEQAINELAKAPKPEKTEGAPQMSGLKEELKNQTKNMASEFSPKGMFDSLMGQFNGFTTKISSITPPKLPESNIKPTAISMSQDIMSKKAEVKPKVEEAPKETKKSPMDIPEAVGQSTLSDVVKSLETLNMQMGQLISVSAEIAEKSNDAVRATKGLNGNLFAR